MKKDNKKQVKTDDKPFIQTRVRRNQMVEVEMKSPAKTILGKVFIWLIVFGMAVIGVIGLIIAIINMA